MVQAQTNLGNMYRLGQGTPVNYQKAVYWYQMAADQNFAEAHFNLGNMYLNGLGVKENEKQALYWYKKSAALGNQSAQELYLQLLNR